MKAPSISSPANLLHNCKFLLYPGIALSLAGLGLGGRLLLGPLQIGAVTLNIHTYFFCVVAILVGFQSILFSLGVKILAVKSGLVPAKSAFAKAMKAATFEIGIGSGVIAIALGFLLAFLFFLSWANSGFGNLSPENTMRVVIPCGCLLATGVQVFLTSAFLSMLDIQIVRR